MRVLQEKKSNFYLVYKQDFFLLFPNDSRRIMEFTIGCKIVQEKK